MTARRLGSIVVFGMTALLAAGAAASEAWIHIRVDNRADDGERVSINVPLTLVEALLPAIDAPELRGGRIRIGDHGNLDGFDLRKVLEALRDAPDGKFVTVRERDESVDVSKEDDHLLVRADNDGERVRVRLPMAVVEAAVSAGSDEIDLLAAVRTLGRLGGGDLVTIESDEESVRIWVDESEASE